jgi:RHS repeat-associated protein
VRRNNGALSEIMEYAPTGELLFRKLGTQGTWYVGSVGTVTATVAASCLGIDTVRTAAGYVCSAAPGTVKVSAHVQVAGGRVASIRAAAGAGVDPVSEVLYYHRDMQGSVVATSYRYASMNGSPGARYRYTPYGQLDRAENVTALSDSELGYTGGLRLGYAAGAAQQGSLVLLGARVYHAELKRWLVPDTVDGRRYTYAGGDPVNFVDPGGRMPIQGGGGGGGGGGGTGGGGGGSLGGRTTGAARPIGVQAMMADQMPEGCFVTEDGEVACAMDTATVSNPPPGNTRPPPGSSLPEPGAGGGGGRGAPGNSHRGAQSWWDRVKWNYRTTKRVVDASFFTRYMDVRNGSPDEKFLVAVGVGADQAFNAAGAAVVASALPSTATMFEAAIVDLGLGMTGSSTVIALGGAWAITATAGYAGASFVGTVSIFAGSVLESTAYSIYRGANGHGW